MALAFFEHCAEGRLEQVQRLLQEEAGAGGARQRLLSQEGLLTGGVRGTPLHAAAAGGHSLVVRALVGAGADHSKTDSGGLPPLSRAAQHNKEDCVRELLKAGASHQRDADGWAPLHYAAGYGGEESMLALLLEDEGKAHLHRMWSKDHDGKSPFVLAFKRGIMSSFFKKLIEHDMGIRAETPNRQLETLVCDLLDIALTDDEAFSQFRDFLFDDRANTDSSILQILRLLAVLVDSKRKASFKFSDAEFSNLGKLVDDSLKDVLQSDFFQRPLATLALLAGALGNRARRRRHVKDDLLALRSKVVQLAVAVLDMPEMDGMDVALEALGYSFEDIDTGAFLTMDKFEKKGLVKEDAPLAFLIANKVNELIAIPQIQSSIDAVFYKARTTDVPPSDTFELSVWEEWSDPTKWKEKQEAAYPDKEIQVHEFYSLKKQSYYGSDKLTGLKEELAATGTDYTNRPFKFMLNKGTFINDWKAQDWRMLPKLYWFSQFLLHGFYLVLTVLVFWHSEETSWYNGALLMMSVGYAAEELSQMLSETGISHYIDDAWNVLDAMFLSSFFVWYATGDKVWLALNLFIVPFRMMHYLTIFKTSGILVAVFFRMIAATCRFLIFFTVILFGFAAMMFAFYGNQEIDGFGSFPDSCLSLFDASLGNYEFSIFDDLDEPWAGVVLLIIFLLLSAVMLLNLLIAVLSQEYSQLADRAYMEWCFMYAQVVQQNVIQDSENFIPGSRLPLHNLQLPPPLSLISYVAKFIVWISGYLEKCATSDRSSLSNSNGHDASIEICGDYGYHSLGQSNPKHLHSVGGIVQDHEQEPQNQAAIGKPAAWRVQILRCIAIIMIAAVDVAVHIIVGLPWALIMLYVRSVKIILGQDDIPKYVIMLLSFDYSIKRSEVDQRYGRGFLKAESGTKVKMATGWFLWLIFGIPLLSILAFIWWIPYASLKERVKQESCSRSINHRVLIMPGSEAAEPSTEGLDEKIREAICKCAVTDDGSEFAQVLGEVAIVKSELADLKTEIAKLNQLLGARDG